ncbi:Dos2-interacting transcription regulator of RNA-Pol-II-domain-containing protein [Limtongia smithiae]|uniref:Dos2-interacting transcription regulator of RNA-Pol-II-domain-containing protein n=1 Tax=Limtongia smithiae TaxID=1125753 RepID=UPI0034CED44E
MSLSDIEQYLLNLDSIPDKAESISKSIAEQIENGNFRLVQLVENLGAYLTDDETAIRVKALSCLAATISKLSPTKLNARQVAMLCGFLGDRLDDEGCLMQSAEGLFALSKMQSILPSSVADMFQVLSTKVDMQKHAQNVRFIVYQILQNLMEKHVNALKTINQEVVPGLCNLISGEKDPRNLMIVFSLLRTLGEKFDISEFKETVFDASFCYFPITFRPPADDPYGITSDDLKTSLRASISSSALLAEYAFPSLIEKLASSSINSKIDTVVTITACVESYGPVTIGEYWETIYNAVKLEVLYDGEENVSDLVCTLLTALARILSFGQLKTLADSPLSALLNAAVREYGLVTQDLENRQAKAAAKILASLGQASFASFDTIADAIIPELQKLMVQSSTSTIAQQRTLLEILIVFIDASGTLFGWKRSGIQKTDRPNSLGPYKDSIFEVFCKSFVSTSSEEVSLRLFALDGLEKLSLLNAYLDEAELGLIVQYLDDSFLTSSSDVLCTAALSSLTRIGTVKPDLILNIAFPELLSQLPDDGISKDQKSKKHYRVILSALAELCVNKGVFDTLTIRLLNRLQAIAGRDDSDWQYAQAILGTLLLVLQTKSLEKEWDLPYFFKGLTPKLVSLTVTSVCDPDKPSAVLSHPLVVSATSRIMNFLLRTIATDEQTEFSKEAHKLFVSYGPSALISDAKRAVVSEKFHPFDKEYAAPRLLELYMYSVAGLQREVSLFCTSTAEFIAQIISSIKTIATGPSDKLALLRLLALVVNKWVSKADETKLLEETIPGLEKSLENYTGMVEPITNLEILAWIVKAFVLKGDRRQLTTVEHVIFLLRDNKLGPYASRACGIMIADDEVLSKSNFVVIRLLAKQQYFLFCIEKLVNGFNSSMDAGSKRNHLVALSAILQYMPGKIVVPRLQSFLPLLLQSLSVDDARVKLAAIDTISATVSDAAALMADHISTILPRLLEATTITKDAGSKSTNPEVVRTAALNCLAIIPKTLNVDIVRPYRGEVIRKLVPVLDDPRREVRKAAVDCRQVYYAMEMQ